MSQMKRAPTQYQQRQYRDAGGAGGTVPGAISPEVRLLLAIGAVLAAVVAEQVILGSQRFSSGAGWIFVFITHILFLLAVAHCIIALALQWNALERSPTKARQIFIAAAASSFLLGMSAVLTLFASATALTGIGIAIATVALIGFLLFRPPEVEEPQQRAQVEESTAAFDRGSVVEPKPMFVDDPLYSAPQPKPMFVDDPLYSVPQPRNAWLFVQAKSNDLLVNCEDACAISPDETRFALCDGTSSSSLPRPWATLLAQQWINEPLLTVNEGSLTQWLEGPRVRWRQWVEQTWLPTINQRNRASGLPLLPPDRALDVVKGGAYATFLGVVLDRKAGSWWAMALGDTCIFQLRPAETGWLCRRCFPLQSSAEFSSTPYTFSSHEQGNVRPLLGHIKIIRSTIRNGDLLVLATDALAKWLLLQLEQNTSEWQVLSDIRDERQFAQFVDQSRSKGMLDDDDTTLIMIPIL